MYPQNPQPRPPQPKKHAGCVTFAIIGVVLVALFGFGGCVAALSSGPDADPTGAAPAATTEPTDTATPTATHHATPSETPTHTAKPKPHHRPKVTFKVSGSAPSGVDITYGSDSDNRSGHGFPWSATLPLDDDAMYYTVYAQLQGGGDISCSVTVDGVTKHGHASGGYNICSAQVNSGLLGGWGSMTGTQPHAADDNPWNTIGAQAGADGRKLARR